MTLTTSMSMSTISVAIFSPQSCQPKRSHLAHIRSSLRREEALRPLLDAILGLSETWHVFTGSRQDIVALENGSHYIRSFSKWIQTGESSVLETSMSGIVTLPLLTIIHIVQYFQYLKYRGIKHSELISRLHDGGIQGHCAGLLAAIVVATSLDETELAKNATTAIRIALGIGVYRELREPSTIPGSTAIVVRLRRESEGNDPKHNRRKLHDLEKAALAKELSDYCDRFDDLKLPDSECLQVPVRSNRTGESLMDSSLSLTAEVINTILASHCDWPSIMSHLSLDLQRTGRRTHTFAMFGMGDSVPLSPFQMNQLDITKLDILSLTISNLPNVRPRTAAHPQDPFSSDAIAIVGAACRLPGANTLEELWDILSHGESKVESLREDRVKLPESFRASQDKEWASKRKFYGNFIDDVDAFDHAFFGISPREAIYMDPQQRLLLATAFEAMDSSGYLRHHRREDGDPVGCFIGASYTEYLENTSAYRPSAFTATGTIRAFLSGKISYHFGWTGPSEVIDTACSASLVAIHRACRAIQAGDCPLALAGGVNIITGIHNYLDLAKAGFLSPTGQCKPFDQSADGYCRADGVGLVVLKSLSRAIADMDHILGVIPASATNQGGLCSPSITVPDSTAQKALYREVLRKADIQPDQVSYVEAHGTGTPVGDPIEIDSIRQVFGGPHRTTLLHIGSLKANVGHSETAAGVASLLKVVAMLAHQSIPRLEGFHSLNPRIPPLEPDNLSIPTELIPWDAERRVACVNGYGASGSNSALLCSEWLGSSSSSSTLKMSPLGSTLYPVLLSAASRESLQAYANDLASYILKSPKGMTLGDVAFTLSERRKHHRIRWSTTASDLSSLVQHLRSDIHNSIEVPKNTKPVVLVFSGQSKTTIGLDPRLCQTNPRLETYLNTCNQVLQNLGCPDIMPSLYQSDPISDVVVLQCGTFAVQYACARCWIDGGLKVDAVIGHSFGELTALAVSGILSLADALKLIFQRANLMKTKWGPDRGNMLAIHADLETVRRIMDSIETATNSTDEALEIACYNSPTSHVVVGKESSITMAEMVIEKDPRYHGLRHQRLNVSNGFHSRFTEPLLNDLVEISKTLEFKEPTIALETSTENPSDWTVPRLRYLADHARNPVYFSNAVRRLEKKLGPCVWLEAGWRTPIIAMAKRAVARPEAHSFQAVTSTAALTANLWLEGIQNTFWSFLSPKELGLKQIWLPPYKFDRPRYWLDHVDRVIEEQKALKALPTTNQDLNTAEKKTIKLVSYESAIGTGGSSHRFRIHTETERYTRIVKGHAVRQRPLCPASMYMECAAMGALMLGLELHGKTVNFQNISFYRGLGCDDSLNVQLCLDRSTESDVSWHFSVCSSKITHAEGDFYTSSSANPDFQLYALLISDQITALKNDLNAERLMTRRAYSLFSRVVDYGDLLQGIHSITLGINQAVAQIKVPSVAFADSESTVVDVLDAISLDTFIQVLGLLINSSGDLHSGDEIYVATAIDKMVVLPCDFRIAQTWTVYAKFTDVTSKQASGAIFVFSEAGELTIIGSGIHFMRIQASKLERLLGASNAQAAAAKEIGILGAEKSALPNRIPAINGIGIRKDENNTVAVPDCNGHVLTQEYHQQQEQDKLHELKSLISTYTGVSMDEIQDDESLGSMGLDSLAAIELADELKSKVDIEVDPKDLLTSDVRSLQKNFPSSNGVPKARTNHNFHVPEPSMPSDQITLLNGDCNGQRKRQSNRPSSRHKVETVVYKEVDGIEIPADLFIPLEAPSHAMPIALMIHGGGHMTLSRKAVRPAQTAFLLSNGILPISLDYRLCPQVNIIDGPITDVRDAYAWAQNDAPGILKAKGIEVDPTKIVVIGWSTGGHLAMTTSWTTPAIGLRPPLAILSFYCPTNYNPSEPSTMGKEYPPRTMSMGEIRKYLPSQPTTSHAFNSTDASGLGWIRPGDPRSELVLALIKEENGMGLLLNGIPANGELIERPDANRAASISPLAQVRAGNYHTPTFLIIGDKDEIVPFHTAVEFANVLKEHGIKSGFLAVPGARHIHDLTLTPGTDGWEEGVAPGYEFLLEQLQMNV